MAVYKPKSAERPPGLCFGIATSDFPGAASAFFKPAATAIVRDIWPAELLVPASSWSSLRQSMAQSPVRPLACPESAVFSSR
jgi:hypothetical protein